MKLALFILLCLGSTARAGVCTWMVGTLAPNYRDIINRQAGRAKFVDREAVRKVLRLKRSDCSTPDGERLANEALVAAVEHHSGRIGAVLPISGKDRERGLAMKQGIEAALGNEASRLIVKDSLSSPFAAERALAELLFLDNVALVLAGGSKVELDRMIPWADGLLIPLLVLGPDKVNLLNSRFASRVYPSERSLAGALAFTANTRGWKRVQIFRPDEGQGDRLIREFIDEAKRKGIELPPLVTYRSGDANTLDQAVRTVFQIDAPDRREELQKLLRDGEKRAKERGLAFDSRTVFLKPLPTCDAILLPDHFRTVRHLSKILAYHGVGKLPMMGGPSWRTSALMEPPDPNLTGSVFADFMGFYDALPEGLTVPGSAFFADPASAATADFGIIGHRAGRIALAAIEGVESRRRVPDRMGSLSSIDANLFGPGPVFASGNQSRWPAFVFTVGLDKLDVMPWLGN